MTYFCVVVFALLFAGFMGGWGWLWVSRRLLEVVEKATRKE
jgi:hypothetical protein